MKRPKNRSECRHAAKPCPFVSCRHHLYLEVNNTGEIHYNFPDKEVWEIGETCSLDVADRGDHTLEEVGKILELTRERIRQNERDGKKKLIKQIHLAEHLESTENYNDIIGNLPGE